MANQDRTDLIDLTCHVQALHIAVTCLLKTNDEAKRRVAEIATQSVFDAESDAADPLMRGARIQAYLDAILHPGTSS